MPRDTNISILHQAALDYFAAGLAIFPCEVGGKRPANAHGCKEPLRSREEVDFWWGEADYNIGLALEPMGWCAIDIDAHKGGEETWAALCREYGNCPPTLTQRTPSGGRHLIFAGSLPPTVGKLGPGVDTRGRGSYILIAPSIINGTRYEVIS